MLDELCEDYEYERKYAIKLLTGGLPLPSGRVHPGPEKLERKGVNEIVIIPKTVLES